MKTLIGSDNRIIFHFNKGCLVDPEKIPMWCIKYRGTTYYVNHVTSKVGWCTKETPLNDSTKGSIKLSGTLSIIEDNGFKEAIIE